LADTTDYTEVELHMYKMGLTIQKNMFESDIMLKLDHVEVLNQQIQKLKTNICKIDEELGLECEDYTSTESGDTKIL
jgi:hypothetical protein